LTTKRSKTKEAKPKRIKRVKRIPGTLTPAEQLKADKAKDARLRLIFNTCNEEYQKVLEFQNYACGVTGKQTPSLYLDHSHATGQLRGLLSYKINKGLGFFDDNPDYLRAAANYLENPPYTLVVGEDVYGVMGKVTAKPKDKKGKSKRFYGPDKTEKPQYRAALDKTKDTK
jgi:hypothetical protein